MAEAKQASGPLLEHAPTEKWKGVMSEEADRDEATQGFTDFARSNLASRQVRGPEGIDQGIMSGRESQQSMMMSNAEGKGGARPKSMNLTYRALAKRRD